MRSFDSFIALITKLAEQYSGRGAAVFLASRYAPDPMNGVVKAAYAIGSDTNHCSMTGGLLEPYAGRLVICHKSRIQDSGYLIQIAQDVLNQRVKKLLPDWQPSAMRTRLRTGLNIFQEP